MKRFLVYLCLLGFLTSCDASKSLLSQWWSGTQEAIHNEPTREIPRGAKPEIIARGLNITFEGQSLRLGDDFASWVDVLGRNYRPASPDNEYESVFLWDELGIKVYLDSPKVKKTVRTFSIDLNFKPLYEAWEPGYSEHKPGTGVIPASFFNGYLEVNGVAIDAASTVEKVNARADGKLLFTCRSGVNICSDIVRSKSEPSIYLSVDEKKEKSVIYSIDINQN